MQMDTHPFEPTAKKTHESRPDDTKTEEKRRPRRREQKKEERRGKGTGCTQTLVDVTVATWRTVGKDVARNCLVQRGKRNY